MRIFSFCSNLKNCSYLDVFPLLENERPAQNGECNADVPEDDQRNVIKIKGKQENCEAAKQALLVRSLITCMFRFVLKNVFIFLKI